MRFFRPLPLVALALAVACAGAAAAQVSRIENTAMLTVAGANGPEEIRSNTVTLDVDRAKRPTALNFRLMPVGHRLEGLKCETSPALQFTPAPIDAATLAATTPLKALATTTPLILVLEAEAKNYDPARREIAWINVVTDRYEGRLPLTETGPDTGVFAGGVPEDGTYPEYAACDLTARRGSRLEMSFTEDEDSLGSHVSMLVDPAGHVFDSGTGAMVDGAEVTLLDEWDRPAVVYGDDGVSAYPSVVVTGTSARDSSGREYVFTPGNYRFPLVVPGSYRIRVKPPVDYTAPSTQDRAFLKELRDGKGQPFIINEASFGGTFTIDSPEPFFSDIPVDRAGDAALLLTKTASVREASPGDFIQYRVTVANRGAMPARNVRLTDTLPRGLRYEIGSERGTGTPILAGDGRSVDFTVPEIPAGGSVDLRYVVTVAPGAPDGEAVNRVRVSGGAAGITGNEAAASVRLRPLLFTDGFTITGRVTEGACGDPAAGRKGVPGIRMLLEDGTFVVTDKDGLYHFEGVRPGRHVVQIDRNTVPASHEPVACDADTRQAGSAISRFVESGGGLMKRVDVQLRPTGKAAAGMADLPVKIMGDAEAAGNRDWFAGQEPGVAMLFPEPGHNPRAPAVRVVVKHRPGQRVALTINGAQSDPINFDGTDVSPDRSIAISRWSGIPVHDGDNRIEARVLAAGGGMVETITRTVHSAGAPVRAMFAADKSRLVADGVTRPLIAVRVTDKDGHPVRAGTLIPFQVDLPYRAATDMALEQARAASRTANTTTARVVGDDGLAFITLEPTTQAGNVHATVTLTEDRVVRISDVRAWLSAAAREWTVVGFGAGTMGYEMLKKRGRALAETDRGGVVTDGQLALYAKGRIKGAWLATLAYDSDRGRDPTRGLLGTIDPDRYYTVYGDGTRQGFDAATERKLYVRLERPEFYALFGDYETGMTATRLGRYSRTLNGGKVEYDGGMLLFTAFAANTDELYARDEIQGNGLSGPYRLSARDIVPNSDKLRIEVRDRFRSELIVSSTALTRHIDYDIDVTMGTIRFRSPVLSRDGNLNPVFIVVDYETYGDMSRKLVAGGRVAARSNDRRLEVGATALHDETVANANVLALDLRAKPTDATEVRAEAATGGRGGLGRGKAWLVEGEHHGGSLDVLAYARQQDSAFGVGQQNVVEAGTRKLGLDGRIRLDEKLSLTGTGWHQQQLDTAGTRTAFDARLELRRASGTAYLGTQIAMDRGIDGKDRDSRLLTLGGTQALMGGKLTLGGQTQIAPGGDKDSVDFPARHQLTAAYRVKPGIRLIGGYEIADGKDFAAHTAQLGLDVTPWRGGKLMTTLNQQAIGEQVGGEDGQRTFAQYGLSQTVPLGKRWTMDATLDASSTVRGAVPAGAVVNAFQPVASGGSLAQDGVNGDFTAVTLGANYRADLWSWNGRVEYRAGDTGDRFGIISNVLRTLGQGKTLAGGLRWFEVSQPSGARAAHAAGDISLAWRPLDSRWSVLERFQLRTERADAGFTDRNVLGVPAYGAGFQSTLRATNNLALNYRTGEEGLGHGVEATVYYGMKWVKGSYGADDYAGYTDVIGFDLRRDLGTRFDIGVQGSVQHNWTRAIVSFSGGPTVGVSPGQDVWVSAGYNVAGYRDRDFEADRYTRSGPFVTLRMKFDQDSVGRAGRALRGSR